MKKVLLSLSILILVGFFISCGATKKSVEIDDITEAEREAFRQTEGDTINISNEEAEYEITIIEPGFNTWLLSIARPEGYYSQSYMENRNNIMVIAWNQRVLQPLQFNSRLYEMQINYQQGVDYGYEVNYKLYNYFIYFQRKYRQRLGPFTPRI